MMLDSTSGANAERLASAVANMPPGEHTLQCVVTMQGVSQSRAVIVNKCPEGTISFRDLQSRTPIEQPCVHGIAGHMR